MNNHGRPLIINTKLRKFEIPDGKPVIIRWKAKNKTRRGYSTAIGWLTQGERPHTFTLVHSAFETIDRIEREYTCTWTIWESQVLDVKILRSIL